jgi:hypothetical protein
MKGLLNNIDWKGQIVSFVGTVLGIIIAFQLEDRQEQKLKEERVSTAIENLNLEITKNLRTLDSISNNNDNWINYLNFLIGKHCENQQITLRDNELDSLRNVYPDYFIENPQILNLIVKKVIKDHYKLYQICFYNSFDEATITTDNLEAAKQSGVFLTMNPNQILYYTQIYRNFNILNDQRVKNYYWTVKEVDSGKLAELIKINSHAGNYNIQIHMCIRSVKKIMSKNQTAHNTVHVP